jgi:hypothetical protein
MTRSTIANETRTYPNRELVVYSLYLLGGDTKRIHTEDIALKCFELYPSSFSWVKYTTYPDKDIVRVALTDARKESYGARVEGRAGTKRGLSAKTNREPIEDGWVLTSRGIEWVRDNLKDLERIAGTNRLKEHRQKLLKQLKKIREHRLFIQYADSTERFYPMIGDIADLLRCRVDAEPEIWQSRFDRIRRQAESAGQGDVLDFINKCQQAYRKQH